MKKILLLGAGRVTKPLVNYLLNYPKFFLIIASRTLSKAELLIENHPNGKAVKVNVEDSEALENLVQEADIVISLLPYTYHVKVAKLCLKYSVNLVTSSYVSKEMRQLNYEAIEKGLLFLNEIGLDPGIDHMSAMKIIDEVEQNDGSIKSFESLCGGLPAPEANNNPFGYKFSWSPRGVLLASRNDAHYLKNSEEIKIDGNDLFKNYWTKKIESIGELEVYPNRDSMIYKVMYGLDNADTVFRGTLRYPGWCEIISNISKLGYLDSAERPDLSGKTYAEITSLLVNGCSVDLQKCVAEYLGISRNSEEIKKLEWLGLFGNDIVNATQSTFLDILTNRMLEKMSYKNGERDMIILQHNFIAEYPKGRKEHITSLMIDYGIPNGETAMARTVSLPAAIAAKLILEDKIKIKGVRIPVFAEIYKPVLAELELMNIKMVETSAEI